MKISYDCEEIIEELKEDIEEFGNVNMYAFFDIIEGYMVLSDYTFIENDMPLAEDEFKKHTQVQVMRAKDILEILEEENKII